MDNLLPIYGRVEAGEDDDRGQLGRAMVRISGGETSAISKLRTFPERTTCFIKCSTVSGRRPNGWGELNILYLRGRLIRLRRPICQALTIVSLLIS